MKPVRLQLSRKKGFNLQAYSRAVNGLPAVNCARPSRWGNPFTVKRYGRDEAVAKFRDYIGHPNSPLEFEFADIAELRGKNLACYCPPDAACHVDVLLEYANVSDI